MRSYMYIYIYINLLLFFFLRLGVSLSELQSTFSYTLSFLHTLFLYLKICFISFLSHISETQAVGRTSAIELLKNTAHFFRKRPFGCVGNANACFYICIYVYVSSVPYILIILKPKVGRVLNILFFYRWLWLEAGSQLALEKTLDVGGFGYPAMVAVNAKKKKFATLRGAFAEKSINDFVGGLVSHNHTFRCMRITHTLTHLLTYSLTHSLTHLYAFALPVYLDDLTHPLHVSWVVSKLHFLLPSFLASPRPLHGMVRMPPLRWWRSLISLLWMM